MSESDTTLETISLMAADFLKIESMNNCNTRHLAKILIHLAWCLQECVSAPDVSDDFEELYLLLDESDPVPNNFPKGQNVGNLIMFSALNFIGKVDVSPGTYLLHQELLIFLSIAMSTQLRSGPTPGPNDVHPFIDADDIHPFIDAAMAQESSLVVRKLFLNYITRPQFPVNSSSSSILSEENQRGVLRRVGSAAANLMLLPFNYLVSSTGEASRSPLAESSLNVFLILSYYHKCISVDYVKYKSENNNS